MNESVKNDLKNICTVDEYDLLVKMIEVIEKTPEKKQKDAIKNLIDEAIN
jgi:ribosomal protein S3AE